jgi:DNA-binding NarL/FixJ family response regulator
MEREIRVMLVDDYEVYREGLRTVVESVPGYRVCAEAERVREAFAHMQHGPFDLLIVNLLLPGMSGLALVREVRRLRGSERILLLTTSADLAVAGEALFAGVNAVVLKSDSRMVLTTALKRIMSGERYISPALPVSSLEDLTQRHTRGIISGPLAPLSMREREVFELFVRGFDNRAVAKELCISTKTVESHRGHIFVKLNLHSMADLVRFAFSRKLASCDSSPADDDRSARIAG